MDYTSSKKAKRVCLRIPVKIPVSIYADGGFSKRVHIDDLSTTGVAIRIKQDDVFPDSFSIKFRIRALTRNISTKVEVKNRSDAGNITRLGCLFTELSEKDRERISKYIYRRCNHTLASKMVSCAALLCSIDASLRVSLRAMRLYYQTVQFRKDFWGVFLSDIYFFVLLAYLAISSVSLIFTDRPVDGRGRKAFLRGLILLLAPLTFIAIKNIIYWRFEFMSSEFFLLRAIFLIHVLFVMYVGFSLGMGAMLLKRIKPLKEVEDVHRAHIRT